MVSPKDGEVDIPIDNGFVGMVDRDVFDEWLRERAAASGAQRRIGRFERITRDADGVSVVHFEQRSSASVRRAVGHRRSVRARCDRRRRRRAIRGGAADGAGRRAHRATCSRTTRSCARRPCRRPATTAARCDVYYRGTLSPDFYGWVFPHGDTLSVGTGSADKGFSLRSAVGELRSAAGLARRRDPAPRRRADPDEAAAALGQRPRRGAGRRCGRRRRAGLGRRHLLRDGRRPAGGRGGRGDCWRPATRVRWRRRASAS